MFQTKTETHHATCIILMLLASGFPEAMAVEGAIFFFGRREWEDFIYFYQDLQLKSNIFSPVGCQGHQISS